jgi:putative methyltransferase (TIGR04325 family)
MLSRLAKTTVTTLRDAYTSRYFYKQHNGTRYRGVYGSYDEAAAALPKGKLHGFADESVPEYYEKYLQAFNPGDYPILFWMQQKLAPGSTVFDFGGGLGQCFYAYQDLMKFPDGMSWRVCDVDALVKRGQDVAQKRKVENLHFTTDRQEASGATFFLTNGTLQYVPEHVSEILSNLAELPQHVLVNRVPMYDGKGYYTVQSSPHSFSPYRIFNHREFIDQVSGLGYEFVSDWTLPRSLHVQFHPELYVNNYRGLYFRRIK